MTEHSFDSDNSYSDDCTDSASDNSWNDALYNHNNEYDINDFGNVTPN